jgi:hypothetical protein
MHKKCGRHDKVEESTNNDEDQFATQFFNFMRNTKTSLIVRYLFHKSIWISALDSLRAVPAPLPITKSTMWMT